MKQLKQGTPVWFEGEIYFVGIIHLISFEVEINCARRKSMKVKMNRLKPLTIPEYIEHVMVTDGWERCKHRVEHIGHEIDISIDVSDISIWPQIQTHDMDGFASIIEEDVKLQQQALTHCEKLNLLKELEI